MRKLALRYLAALAALAIVTTIVHATTNGPQPAVGLYWYINTDPTVGAGMPAPLNQLLIRTDTEQIYYKSGGANTAWTPLSTGGGGGTVTSIACGTGLQCVPGSPIVTGGTINVSLTPTTCLVGQAEVSTAANGTSACSTFLTPNLVNVGTLEDFLNLGNGTFNNVDLWSGGAHTSRVEVDTVGATSGPTITGIVAGSEGDLLWLWNGGGAGPCSTAPCGMVTLVNNSASSLAANRIWVADGKQVNIPNNDGVQLIYINGFGWTVFGGATSILRAQQLSLDAIATPAALANGSTTNNYNPFGAAAFTSYVRQDTGLAATLTGIVAAGAPNAEGRILAFQNISTTGTITLTCLDAGSASANQIDCATSITLAPLSTLLLLYDLNAQKWRPIGNSSPAIVSTTAPITGNGSAGSPIGLSLTTTTCAAGQAEITTAANGTSTCAAFVNTAGTGTAISGSTTLSLSLTPMITPPALGGVVNDYAPAGIATASEIIQDAGVDSTITGIAAQPDGRVLTIRNSSASHIITLANANAGSLAANRFTLPISSDWRLMPGSSLALKYNLALTTWTAITQTTGYPVATIEQLQIDGFALPGALPANPAITEDWNPSGLQTNTMIHVVTNTVGSTLGGIVAPTLAPTAEGRILILENHGDGSGSYGTSPLTLLNRSAGSGVNNVFVLPNLSNLTLPYTGSVIFNYDKGAPGWIALGTAQNGSFISLVGQGQTFSSPVTPAALPAGNTNNYDPAGNATSSYLRLNGNAGGSTLTGLVVHNPGSATNEAPIRFIQNVGGPITLSSEDTNSTAANRFNFPAGSYVLPPNGVAVLIYDTQGGGVVTAARWRLYAGSGMFSKLTLYDAITDLALGATVNNYSPTGFGAISRLRLAPSGGTTNLTGLAAQEDGALRTITAYATGLTLQHQNGGSLAANRFFLPGGADITLPNGGSIELVYDATFGAWFSLGQASTSTVSTTSPITGNGSAGSPIGLSLTTTTCAAGQAEVTTAANGTSTCSAFVTSSVLTAGTIPKASGAGALTNSAITESGTLDSTGTNAFASQMYEMTGRLVPATLTSGANNNDYNPANLHTFQYLAMTTSSGTAATLTGMNAGVDGEMKTLCNYGTGNIIVTNADVASAAANTFWLNGAVSLTLHGGAATVQSCATFRYEAQNNHWIEISASQNDAPTFNGTVAIGGHLRAIGSGTPTLSGCGSAGFSIVGTDFGGTVNIGTLATGCTITFAATYTTAPHCTVTSESGLLFSYALAATTITVTGIGNLSSTSIDYTCVGN